MNFTDHILSQFLVLFEHVARAYFVCSVEEELPKVEPAAPGPNEAAIAGGHGYCY